MAVISGGTTLIDNGALDAAVPTGSLILLSTQTASSSASIEFTSGIDSTYDSYVFKFINIHPSVDSAKLQFNFSIDSGSNYNVTKTSSAFFARHKEDDTNALLLYATSDDLAQSTSFQNLHNRVGTVDDENMSGSLQVFNPSSTTYVKHFTSVTNTNSDDDYAYEWFIAGYGNTTSAIDAIQFKMSSGNIDDGIIKMYGVK